MIQLIKSNERGLADHGWLKSLHTFSFAEYFNPSRMGFGVLRVINEDRIEGGTGFGTHPHRDMEIISYVIEGALEHQDSMGTKAVIRPGEVQRMSAGTGVQHSEYNQLRDQKAHFLQIWIKPEKIGVSPGYDQKSFATELATGKLVLVASKMGREGSISINQDVDLYAAKSSSASKTEIKVRPGRKLWLQNIKGQLQVDGQSLQAGDAAAIEDLEKLKLEWNSGSEFLMFDLP